MWGTVRLISSQENTWTLIYSCCLLLMLDSHLLWILIHLILRLLWCLRNYWHLREIFKWIPILLSHKLLLSFLQSLLTWLVSWVLHWSWRLLKSLRLLLKLLNVLLIRIKTLTWLNLALDCWILLLLLAGNHLSLHLRSNGMVLQLVLGLQHLIVYS